MSWYPTQLFIDNAWLDADSGQTSPVTNPANGRQIANVAHGGAAECRRAVDAAVNAFPGWKATPAPRRAELLMAIHDVLLANRERLAQLLTAENGKPIAQARGEIDYAASFYRWFSEQARRLPGRSVPHPDPDVVSWVDYEPVGVIGAITPWNFPIAQSAKKLSASLAAGCAAVLKPAPDTPLLGLAMGWVAQEAGLPPGIINIVTGEAAPIGEVFFEDPRVRCVSITGSVRTGRLVAERAGARLKHSHMELGGNCPFIVCDDADLDHAVDHLMKLKFLTNGQTCVTANRVFLHEAIAGAFIDR